MDVDEEEWGKKFQHWKSEVDQVFNIYIDSHENVALDVFDQDVDEGTFSGSTKHGITWTCMSLTQPQHFGFNGQYNNNQKHCISIEVPATIGLMKDGKP
jgi:hypothetical protein